MTSRNYVELCHVTSSLSSRLPYNNHILNSKEFQLIKDRLWKKLKGWQSILLSGAGKVALIQYVAQAVPLYAMSYFKFPKSFVNELNMIIAKFWWKVEKEKKGIH